MRKSWLSIFLPEDEYKEKRILYFLAEAAILLIVSLIVISIINLYVNISVEVLLLISISIFLLYVTGRYIFSGIEYTEVATEKAYKKQKKKLVLDTLGFLLAFIGIYFLLEGLPRDRSDWVVTIGLFATLAVVSFIINVISLKRSYRKNRELL